MAIKARRIATKTRLKAASKKGAFSDDEWITALTKDEPLITVRFLTEPEDWIEYTEHYSEQYRYFPCSDNCPGCADDLRASKRFLTAVVDVEGGAIKYLKLPKTVIATLYRCYENYGTIMNCDYQISRQGTGMTTEYIVLPSQPTGFKFSKFPLPDNAESWSGHCLSLLESRLPSAQDGEDEEDVLPPRSKTRSSQPPTTPSRGRVQPKKSSLYEYEDDDEDDEDEDESVAPSQRSERPAKPATRKTLKPLTPRR